MLTTEKHTWTNNTEIRFMYIHLYKRRLFEDEDKLMSLGNVAISRVTSL